MKKAVIYCRVSTKEQVEEGNSLVTQEKICREYALKEGYDIAEIFIEQGESAKTANRTELQKLLSYCAITKNSITTVIIYKLDRLSRNTDDYSQIRLLLKRYGVEIKSTTEYFENTPAGRFMENIISNVSQFDNDVRTERSISGMREAVREGRYVWLAPIGYSNIRKGGKSTITPNEMAPLVRLAFKQVSENIYPIHQVLRNVTKEGLVSKVGKPFSKSQFYYMLANELYAGWIIKFGERHRGLFEPIVTEELFNKVQIVLKQRSRKNTHYITKNPDFPLRRFVKHPSGRMLTGSWSKGRNQRYAYYRFGMNGGNYALSSFENTFKEFQNQFSLDRERCKKLKSYIYKKTIGATAQQEKESVRLKKYILELNEKQNILIQKNMKGVINDMILKTQLEIIEKQIFDAQSSLGNIPESSSYNPEILKFMVEYMENPGNIWAKSTFDEKIQLQWFHFPQGVTFDGSKFGTAETSFIFKAKDGFLTHQSGVVPLDIQFWNQVVSDCVHLANILKKCE